MPSGATGVTLTPTPIPEGEGLRFPLSFGQPGAVDYRNPILAEAMRVTGLVQRYGFGIPAARRELRRNGQEGPEFRVEPTAVFCTVRVKGRP